MRKLLLLLSLAVCTNASADDAYKHQLATGLCYSMQAIGACQNLNMRLGLEQLVNDKVGQEVRNSKSDYFQSCLAGNAAANEDDIANTLCSNAWERYGCDGSEVVGLLQENPFQNKDGVFCEFN